jgi:hypothetical protein
MIRAGKKFDLGANVIENFAFLGLFWHQLDVSVSSGLIAGFANRVLCVWRELSAPIRPRGMACGSGHTR